ncbi:hypothetical protein AURDEDRAFT_130854 [Auricularia subglabra TFB-10046 SS5]|uniref:Uncharacterized protein n=1 Tax=Auricularia subglabra (strain TFB-10046 / SS5) TaxID=717982 RepID=J0D7E2_AURST|nr:hypothetical protein AURDEDRAFT_130854 [Auricularia subglabra TFB-10046 SS5]
MRHGKAIRKREEVRDEPYGYVKVRVPRRTIDGLCGILGCDANDMRKVRVRGGGGIGMEVARSTVTCGCASAATRSRAGHECGPSILRDAQHISAMRLLEVDSNHLKALISLFGDAFRMHLEISFETVHQTAHIIDTLQLLRHCPTLVSLTCYVSNGRTTLNLHELSGRVRKLEYPSAPDAVLPRVWTSLVPTTIVNAVQACLTAWPLLCRCIPQPNFDSLGGIEVIVDQPVQALSPVSLGLPAQAAQLPWLRGVTIYVASPAITIPIAWLCSLVKSLNLRHVLPHLKVANTSIVGPLALLRGLVWTISDAQRADIITPLPVFQYQG